MWINTIFIHADIANSFRVSLVVMIYSIWAHGGGESFFGNSMCVFWLISGSGSGFKIRFMFCTQLAI